MENEKDIYILAIESSCDDTSAAVMLADKVLSNVTASQAVHEQYGGVVPELASRAHELNIVPVVYLKDRIEHYNDDDTPNFLELDALAKNLLQYEILPEIRPDLYEKE